jgi:hypothetical protein
LLKRVQAAPHQPHLGCVSRRANPLCQPPEPRGWGQQPQTRGGEQQAATMVCGVVYDVDALRPKVSCPPIRADRSPVRPFLLIRRSSSAAIPDQAPGSGPLRVLLPRLQRRSLVRAPQEGGSVPAGHTPQCQLSGYTTQETYAPFHQPSALCEWALQHQISEAQQRTASAVMCSTWLPCSA